MTDSLTELCPLWTVGTSAEHGTASQAHTRPVANCKTLTYTVRVEIVWADEDAQYIRTRSGRYPGALDIEPDWTREVLADMNVVELSPYPGSRVGASGFVGYSSSARRVLVVIAYRDLDGDLHGLNVWPASGRDLATYKEGSSDG
jgi:hypothetical protein